MHVCDDDDEARFSATRSSYLNMTFSIERALFLLLVWSDTSVFCHRIYFKHGIYYLLSSKLRKRIREREKIRNLQTQVGSDGMHLPNM